MARILNNFPRISPALSELRQDWLTFVFVTPQEMVTSYANAHWPVLQPDLRHIIISVATAFRGIRLPSHSRHKLRWSHRGLGVGRHHAGSFARRLASLAFSFFHVRRRAAVVFGYISLSLLVFIGVFFFFFVVPSFWGSQDGCLTETRLTLGTLTVDTALFLTARLVANLSFSHTMRNQNPDEHND